MNEIAICCPTNELGECYICTLDSAPLSPCNCRNMYLHYQCQIKLIHEKGEKCSICLEEFNNVNVYTKVKYYYSWRLKSVFFIVILNVGMLGVGVYEIMLYLTLDDDELILLILGILFILKGIILGILIYKAIKQLYLSDKFYEIKNERIITLKL